MFRSTVLVVDDDEASLLISRARLEDAGYTVVTRDESLGTVRAMADIAPDVVLLDVMMPALSGDRLADVIKGRPGLADIPIIFHSSKQLSNLQTLADDKGALGAIAKTADDASFIAQFERLYRRRPEYGT